MSDVMSDVTCRYTLSLFTALMLVQYRRGSREARKLVMPDSMARGRY